MQLLDGKSSHKLSISIFKILRHVGCAKINFKKMMNSQDFVSQMIWTIEGCVTKVVKQIAIDFSLLIQNTIKVLNP